MGLVFDRSDFWIYEGMCKIKFKYIWDVVVCLCFLWFLWFFRLSLYDIKLNRWYRFLYIIMMEEKIEMMCIGDGGLMCVVFIIMNKKRFFLFIIVFNILIM